MIEGALIWLACELRDVHDGGDHVIATGAVLELEAGDGEPLVFYRRRVPAARTRPHGSADSAVSSARRSSRPAARAGR